MGGIGDLQQAEERGEAGTRAHPTEVARERREGGREQSGREAQGREAPDAPRASGGMSGSVMRRRSSRGADAQGGGGGGGSCLYSTAARSPSPAGVQTVTQTLQSGSGRGEAREWVVLAGVQRRRGNLSARGLVLGGVGGDVTGAGARPCSNSGSHDAREA